MLIASFEMQKAMKSTIAVAGLFVSACCAQALTAPGTNTYTPPANIVTLRSDADPEAVARDFGLTPVNVYRHAFKGFAVTVPTNQLAALRADPRVLAVEGNGHVSLCAQTNSTGFSRMSCKTYPMIHFNGVDDTRIDVDVAIMDTGIQTNHPDLNVYRAVACADVNLPPDDWYGHGTHVAGICGALDNDIGVVGVAPGVRLWSVRVIGPTESEFSNVLMGWDYVAAHSDEIEIVNCSFSNDGVLPNVPLLAIELSLSNLVNRGVLVIAAAGNSSLDILGLDGIYGTDDDHLPAANPWVCAVSAIADFDGELGQDYIAPFTNFSSKTNAQGYFVTSSGLGIDVCAPGYEIRSTWINSSYQTLSGTSMAAPHVAGVAALYIAANGRATNAAGVFAIRQAIIDAAQPQSQWDPLGQNNPPGETWDPDDNKEPLAVPSLSWVPQMRFLSTQMQTNGLALNFTTLPGYTHTVQYRTNLIGTNDWSTLANAEGTGNPTTVLDRTATNSTGFYRLATVPTPATPAPQNAIAINNGYLGTNANGTYTVFFPKSEIGPIIGDPTNLAVRFSPNAPGGQMGIPFLPALNPTTAFSVEFWAKPAQATSIMCPVASVDFTLDLRSGWLFYQGNSTLTDGNGFYFRFYDTSGGTNFTAATIDFPTTQMPGIISSGSLRANAPRQSRSHPAVVGLQESVRQEE